MTATDPNWETLPPPAPPEEAQRRTTDPRTWVQENLFNSPVNSILTVVFGLIIAFVLFRTPGPECLEREPRPR